MAKQVGGKAPITGPILESERDQVPIQKSAVDHGDYLQAHEDYSKMNSSELRAHSLALAHVKSGKVPASKQQLDASSTWD